MTESAVPAAVSPGGRARPGKARGEKPRRRRAPTGRLRLVLGVALSLLMGGCAIPRWPVEAPLTSAYGVRWRGILPEIHRGVDLKVGTGTPVRAMAPGRVRFSGTMEGFGRVVWVEHGGEVLTVYAHLSELRVGPGAPVEARQVLGLSGASGDAGGPHLHFELWRWGRPVDPVRLLGGLPAR